MLLKILVQGGTCGAHGDIDTSYIGIYIEYRSLGRFMSFVRNDLCPGKLALKLKLNIRRSNSSIHFFFLLRCIFSKKKKIVYVYV